MKRIIAYITSWTLYWLGHWTSYVVRLYPIYKSLMYNSMRIQDWAGNETPWQHIKQNTESKPTYIYESPDKGITIYRREVGNYNTKTKIK